MAKGDHDWVTSEVVTAANMDDFVQLQVVGQYDTAAARDTALSARKREGMVTYQLDTNTLTVYTGAAWSTVGPVHGLLTAYTPTLTQSGAVAKTVTDASYIRVGRMIIGNVTLSCTGTGTGSNSVIVGLPVTAALTSGVIGTGYVYDASATLLYVGALALTTNVSAFFYPAVTSAPSPLGVAQFTAALASGDGISYSFNYQVAADG